MLADAYDAKQVEALTIISQEQEAMKQQLRSSIQQVSTEAHPGCWLSRAWIAGLVSTQHGTRHALVTMPAGPLEDVWAAAEESVGQHTQHRTTLTGGGVACSRQNPTMLVRCM